MNKYSFFFPLLTDPDACRPGERKCNTRLRNQAISSIDRRKSDLFAPGSNLFAVPDRYLLIQGTTLAGG